MRPPERNPATLAAGRASNSFCLAHEHWKQSDTVARVTGYSLGWVYPRIRDLRTVAEASG